MQYTAIDIESTGLHHKLNKITYIGFRTQREDGTRYSIHLKEPSTQDIMDTLEKIGTSRYVMHNGKFDTKLIKYQKNVVIPIHEDTMYMAYLCGNVHEKKMGRGSLSLKACAKRELGVEDWDVDLETKTGFGEATEAYLDFDLEYTLDLFFHYNKIMREEERPIYALMRKAAEAYRDVEINGIYLEQDRLEEVRTQISHDTAKILNDLRTEHGDVNFNSSKQLAKLLYVDLELPCFKYTKTGNPATNKHALTELVGKHPIAKQLLDYKDGTKALTFLDDWSERLKKTGDSRLYPNFNLHTTATGRTSCSEPNIQQVPRNKALKSLFTAPKGYKFVQIDYSQMELRIAAYTAGITGMKEAYNNGEDIHRKTAMAATGKTEITKADRTGAKAINFGFLYGMSYKTYPEYAKTTYGVDVEETEAYALREAFFLTYPELLPFYDSVENELISTGEVKNCFGRIYKIGLAPLSQRMYRSQYSRSSINYKVQSAASDIALMAIVHITKVFKDNPDVKLVGSVHDSILFEIKEDEHMYDNLRKIREIMQRPDGLDVMLERNGQPPMDIKIVADVEIGPWGSGEEIDLDEIQS